MVISLNEPKSRIFRPSTSIMWTRFDESVFALKNQNIQNVHTL